MLNKTQRLLSMTTAIVVASASLAAAEPSAELIAAAKKEGTLTTIALPHSWCGYGDVIAAFKTKYGIEVNELNPDAGSGDEIEAIKANKGNKGPQAPDVIDVGLSFGPSAKAEGLLMPYKVSTWDSIPDSAKDAEGYWYGDYYGVLSFVVNTDIVKDVPKDWADLKKSELANSVALAGDPRASNQAVQAVYAAGLAAGEKDAAKAGEAGLSFFADVNKAEFLFRSRDLLVGLVDPAPDRRPQDADQVEISLARLIIPRPELVFLILICSIILPNGRRRLAPFPSSLPG